MTNPTTREALIRWHFRFGVYNITDMRKYPNVYSTERLRKEFEQATALSRGQGVK